MTVFNWPENADRFYAIAEGVDSPKPIVETEHTIVVPDTRFAPKSHRTRLVMIPKEPLISLEGMDFADALRWVDMRHTLAAMVEALGWGPTDGFRIDIPVHPPYQREPWLQLLITRDHRKKIKPGQRYEASYTRHDGHFSTVATMQRRAEIVYNNQSVMVCINPDEEDNLLYDANMSLVLRRKVPTILSPEFTDEDWLSLAAAIRQSARRSGLDAYHVYINCGPPYQHTAWVHAHLMAGARAMPRKHTGDIAKKRRPVIAKATINA